MTTTSNRQGREGSAILIAMFFMVMSVSMVGIFISYSLFEADLTRRSIDKEKARIAAESALDYGIIQLKDLVIYNHLTLSRAGMQALLDAQTGPTPAGDYVFTGPSGEDGYYVTVHTEPISGVITQGTTGMGLPGEFQIFTVTAGARNPNTGNSVVLQQSLQALGLPLIRFGVFYQDDLEMNPGPNMDMYGPVHCNADIYISPGANLLFHDRVTSYGEMYRHRKDDTSSSGYVGIDNALNNEVAMTIDSTYPNWMVDALNNWDGRVLSRSHSVAELSPPIASVDSPHDIVERALVTNDVGYHVETEQEKFANKACLVIRILTNGTFTAKDFFGVDVSARFTNAVLATTNISGQVFNVKTNNYFRFYSNTVSGAVSNGAYAISQTNFYDHREGCYMRPVDIYINELVREFPGITNAGMSNAYSIAQGRGVVYVTRDDPDGNGALKPCVRLRNGARLPPGGLSFASDVPVYIEGNYNSITNFVVPAFVAGDAVSELSTAWQDARSKTNLSLRVPSNTTYNVVILTGNNETTLGHYNGGLENVMRFLEDWNGSRTVTFRGSIIDLWEAEIATGPWIYGSPIYTAPIRNYGYDDIYRTQTPPGMTTVFGLEPTLWSEGHW